MTFKVGPSAPIGVIYGHRQEARKFNLNWPATNRIATLLVGVWTLFSWGQAKVERLKTRPICCQREQTTTNQRGIKSKRVMTMKTPMNSPNGPLKRAVAPFFLDLLQRHTFRVFQFAPKQPYKTNIANNINRLTALECSAFWASSNLRKFPIPHTGCNWKRRLIGLDWIVLVLVRIGVEF